MVPQISFEKLYEEISEILIGHNGFSGYDYVCKFFVFQSQQRINILQI